MELIPLKGLRAWCASVLLIIISSSAIATPYTYNSSGGLSPSTPFGTQPPIPPTTSGTQFTNGDSLDVQTGTMATGSSSLIGYTVGITDTSSTAGIAITLTVDLGATLSYSGSVGSGAAFFSTRQDDATTTTVVNINGTISAGSGLYSISVANGIGDGPPTAADTYNINISSTASVSGAIASNGVFATNLNILSGSPTINGVINLAVSKTGTSTLTIGSSGAANFTTTYSIENIGFLHITNASTMNLNTSNTNMNAITVDTNCIFNVNYLLNGLTTSDGTITNNGTMNIAANIAKIGTFVGSGTNVITEGSASGLTISTSNYQVANHTAVLQDLLNYGNITLPTANFKLNNGLTNRFNIVYGSNGYSPGYFPGGTYTLVTTTVGTVTAPTPGSMPANTLFLSFANPVYNSNNIQITLTRTPFNVYASTMLTESIGSNLEVIGNNSPDATMLTILDAVEASTTQQQVEYALRQLAPLANAPFYGYAIQNESMYQVQLRLASLRDATASYFAGDIGKDNHAWARGFGSYGNQRAKQDSLGYYASSGGVATGFDRNLDDHYTVGAAFAYALSHINDKINPQSVTDLKSYIGMVYGTYNFSDTAFLDWILGVTINNFSANRLVNINGLYNQVATSSYSSQQISIEGLWSKNYEAFGFMQLTPEAQAQYTFSKQYTYAETGAPGANLTISRTNSDVISLAVGGIAAVPILLDPSIIMPEIHCLVYYNPVVGKQNTVFSFVAGGGPITSIMDLSRTALQIGTALTIAVVDKLEIRLNFDYDVADRFNGYTAYLNLRYFL